MYRSIIFSKIKILFSVDSKKYLKEVILNVALYDTMNTIIQYMRILFIKLNNLCILNIIVYIYFHIDNIYNTHYFLFYNETNKIINIM